MIKLKKLLLEDESGLGSSVSSAASRANTSVQGFAQSIKNYKPRQGFFNSLKQLKSQKDALGVMFMYWFVEALNSTFTTKLRNKVSITEPDGTSNEAQLKPIFANAVKEIRDIVVNLIDKDVIERMEREGDSFFKGSKQKSANVTVRSDRGNELYLKVKKVDYKPHLDGLLKSLIYDGNESVFKAIIQDKNVKDYPITDKNIYNVIYTMLKQHIEDAIQKLKDTPEWKNFNNGIYDDGDESGKSGNTASKTAFTIENYSIDKSIGNIQSELHSSYGNDGNTILYLMLLSMENVINKYKNRSGTEVSQNQSVSFTADNYSKHFKDYAKNIMVESGVVFKEKLKIVISKDNSFRDVITNKKINISQQFSEIENAILFNSDTSLYAVSAKHFSDDDGNVNISTDKDGIATVIYNNLYPALITAISKYRKQPEYTQSTISKIKL